MCRRFGLFGVRMVGSYLFIRSSSRRFYAAKGSWATERSVSSYLAKGKRKAPRGCRLAVYLPTDTLLRDSGQAPTIEPFEVYSEILRPQTQ